MTKRWYLAALASATLAGIAVVRAPERPLWQASLGTADSLAASSGRFSPDGRSYVIAYRDAGSGRSPAFVYRFDAFTGDQLSVVPLAVPHPDELHLTGDTQRVVVVHNRREPPPLAVPAQPTLRISLMDSTTGQIVSEFDSTLWNHRPLETSPISVDGRWIALANGDHKWEIVNTATGKPLIAVPPPSNAFDEEIRSLLTMLATPPPSMPSARIGRAVFRPDGGAVALYWEPFPDSRRIAVVSLPDGAVRLLPPPPAGVSQKPIGWWNGQLWLSEWSDPSGLPSGRVRLLAVDLRNGTTIVLGSFGEPGDLCHLLEQPENLPVVHHQPMVSSSGLRDWLRGQLKPIGLESLAIEWTPSRLVDVTTGAELNRTSRFWIRPGQLSPECQRVATISGDGVLTMWRLGQPRGPWACLAGAGAALVVLLVGRWRAKR